MEWVVAKEHPNARTVTGHEALEEYLREWQEMLPDVRFEQERLLDVGEKVLAIGRVQGTGAGSAAEVRVAVALLCTFEDGLITRVEEYLDPAEALNVAGVSQ